MDGLPDGPRKIGDRHQVTLPADQLAAIGLGPGQQIWVALNPDRPGTLVLLPRSAMKVVFAKGWNATKQTGTARTKS